MYKVLVVDDADIMRLTLKRNLVELGHQVVAEAKDGFNAIELYKSEKPDIVTLDITMPAVNGITNGLDALVKIKEFDPNAHIIMITSHGEEKLIIEAISKGAKGYILKPITKDKVDSAIQKLKL